MNGNFKSLKDECVRLFCIANKRIKRLEECKLSTPALESVNATGGKFCYNGDDLKQLQHEYSRCVNFLYMPTSTITGAREFINKLSELLSN